MWIVIRKKHSKIFLMRTCYYLLILVLSVLLSSCSVQNMTGIRSMKHDKFEPLMLKPAIETNNLRIDVIRQSEEERENDSVVTSKDSPYHPLGFNLGNGLFYDLNENLSFRIDELLGVTGSDCWSLERLEGRRRLRADYRWTVCGDTLTVNYPPGRRKKYLHHLVRDGKTTSVKFRNRLLYAIDSDTGRTVYRYRTRKLAVIDKDGEYGYIVRKGLGKDYFRLQENRLLLKRDYIIELTDSNQKIKIIQPGWFNNRVLLTMEKSGKNLYLYDRNYHGWKFESGDNGIILHRNGRIQKWHLSDYLYYKSKDCKIDSNWLKTLQ